MPADSIFSQVTGISNYQGKLSNLVVQKFANNASCIPAKLTPFEVTGYVIDAGGTKTAVAKMINDSNGQHFVILKNCENDYWCKHDLVKEADGRFGQIKNYFRSILFLINDDAVKNSVQVKNVSFVWSNNAKITYRSDPIKGVHAFVEGIGNGKDYRKEEPFITGLQNGDDLSRVFIETAAEFNIKLERLIFGNDTVFVGVASLNNPDAAGVNSSGANMAVQQLIDGKLQWINCECGGRILLSKDMLSIFEQDLDNDDSIESVIAGKWLGLRFIKILDQIEKDLTAKSLPDYLRSVIGNDSRDDFIKCFNDYRKNEKIFLAPKGQNDGTLIVAKIYNQIDFQSENNSAAELLINQIAIDLANRAIDCTAAMIVACLDLSDSKKNYKVAMDSRVLEGLDPKLKRLHKTLLNLTASKIEVELMKGINIGDGLDEISVPQIGAGRALFGFK